MTKITTRTLSMFTPMGTPNSPSEKLKERKRLARNRKKRLAKKR